MKLDFEVLNCDFNIELKHMALQTSYGLVYKYGMDFQLCDQTVPMFVISNLK